MSTTKIFSKIGAILESFNLLQILISEGHAKLQQQQTNNDNKSIKGFAC